MTSCKCQSGDQGTLRRDSTVESPQYSGLQLIKTTRESLPADQALSELFGVSLTLSAWRSSGGIRYMPRWRHHGGGGPIPAMKGHLITVCHSGWGMVVVSTNGHRKLGQLRRGVVSIVPEGTDGHFDITGESECSQVIVPSTLLVERGVEAGMTERVALQQQTTVPDPVLYQLVDMLSRDDKSCSVSERFREQCAALICTHLLIRYTKRTAPELSVSSGLASWQLRRIKKYVLENLQLRLTLQDLAKEVALSRHYLCTAFRAATGFTPQEYVTSVRIERAKELLAESRLSIGDIAASVGYRTASAFTACFRKATGVTPRHFRAAA